MMMTAELLKVMKLLEENNIEAIAFKGPILSQMAYGDITLRQYVDLDILIDEKDLERTFKILELNSYVSNHILNKKILENKSIFHDCTFIKKGISFEFHWRLFSDEYKTDFDSKFTRNNLENIILNNFKFKIFEHEVFIIYLCIHGAKHNWERIEWLLDIVKYSNNYKINWKRLHHLSKETKSEKILISTMYLCQNILGMKIDKYFLDLLKNPKILKLSKDFESLFYERFDNYINKKIDTKEISKIQFKLLEGFSAKTFFILSLLKPTEQEYKILNLPKGLNFVYYFFRPFNVFFRWIKKL